MYNQYLLKELIWAQVKAEQVGTIKDDLQKHGIDIDDLVISGDRSLPEVFHPSSNYNHIERVLLKNVDYFYHRINRKKRTFEPATLTLDVFQLSVEGIRNNNHFKAIIGHKDISFPFPYDKTGASLAKLEKVEQYLRQRQAEQQPEYIHTYRTKTEIKLPKIK